MVTKNKKAMRKINPKQLNINKMLSSFFDDLPPYINCICGAVPVYFRRVYWVVTFCHNLIAPKEEEDRQLMGVSC